MLKIKYYHPERKLGSRTTELHVGNERCCMLILADIASDAIKAGRTFTFVPATESTGAVIAFSTGEFYRVDP